MKLIGLSLFANVWIAETYLDSIWVDIAIATDIDQKRMDFYKHLYPKTKTITWDITNKDVRDNIIKEAKEMWVNLILATPPCQWMSVAWKGLKDDPRNQLLMYAVEIIKAINPQFIFLENVPQQQKYHITIEDKQILIPEYIKSSFMTKYIFNKDNLIKFDEHWVPQMRKRNIYLLTSKELWVKWTFPEKENKIITLKEAIGHLPQVDPLLKEGLSETLLVFPNFLEKQAAALKFSKFHTPPTHSKNHILWMKKTPSWNTAFWNEIYFPKKPDGTRINGHQNTYRRFSWDNSARTITQNNWVISSLCCVHPWRLILDDWNEESREYSDPRVLTLAELFIVSSLPPDWNPPSWANESYIRRVIGEWIPPLVVKKIFLNLLEQLS
jgi:DNA (cytosine-5)-methyltransferase 1